MEIYTPDVVDLEVSTNVEASKLPESSNKLNSIK